MVRAERDMSGKVQGMKCGSNGEKKKKGVCSWVGGSHSHGRGERKKNKGGYKVEKSRRHGRDGVRNQ